LGGPFRVAADGPPGPVIAGPVIAGPVIAGPVIAGPVIAGPVIAGPVIAGGSSCRPMVGDEVPGRSLPQVGAGERAG
jgi:hypothetical protein